MRVADMKDALILGMNYLISRQGELDFHLVQLAIWKTKMPLRTAGRLSL